MEKLGDRTFILTTTYDKGRSILVDHTCAMQWIVRYRRVHVIWLRARWAEVGWAGSLVPSCSHR